MRILFILLPIILLVFQPPPSFAKITAPWPTQKEQGWLQNGKPVPDSENIKSLNGFGAQLWLLSDDSIFENWLKPQTPSLNITKTAVRNQPIFLIFLFINPGVDKSSKSNVTADVTIISPDGGVYGHFKDMEIWQREYLFPTNTIQLAVGNLGINIEDTDQLGTYKVNALIKDHNKGVFFKLITDFTAK